MLVLEAVEDAGIEEPAPRLLRVCQRRELEEDKDVVRVVDAAKDPPRRRLLTRSRTILVEEWTPGFVVARLDPGDDERRHAGTLPSRRTLRHAQPYAEQRFYYPGALSTSRPAFSSPDDLSRPTGYSHVVEIPPGRLVWTAGQVALEAEGELPEDAGWEGQTRLAFANVGRALRSAGADWPDVVKLTIYVVDVTELPTIRAVRDEHVDTATPPTSTLVQVTGLVRPELLIEVEAVAWLSGA
jgi:enamine deaminase RidA (YjgF/YER057c/UK114 family)